MEVAAVENFILRACRNHSPLTAYVPAQNMGPLPLDVALMAKDASGNPRMGLGFSLLSGSDANVLDSRVLVRFQYNIVIMSRDRDLADMFNAYREFDQMFHNQFATPTPVSNWGEVYSVTRVQSVRYTAPDNAGELWHHLGGVYAIKARTAPPT